VPARSADDVRIETYSGPRVNLRRLFELAEDSAAELDSYIDAGRVLVATAAADIGNLRFYQRQGFRMRSVERDAFTPATGYPPGLLIDGIELRDRVWLDRVVLASSGLNAARADPPNSVSKSDFVVMTISVAGSGPPGHGANSPSSASE